MGRVVTEAELVDLVATDRRQGTRIAFANGCFDVLHVGHVRYLQGAAAEADRLIVAINDDESERRLKGSARPIMPQSARAELVAALRGVDYVVLFTDPTVARLLTLLEWSDPEAVTPVPVDRTTLRLALASLFFPVYYMVASWLVSLRIWRRRRRAREEVRTAMP